MSERPGDTRCPEAVLAAIPWYPDRGLPDAERGAVEAHAAGCPACRREIEWMQGRGPDAAPAAPDPERVFARVRALIEANPRDAGASSTQAARVGSRPHARATPMRWRVAASIAAALVLSSAALLWIRGGEPGYETATTPSSSPSSPPGTALDVVFRDDASAAQIREALHAVGANIVSGPTPLGVYRLRLSGSAAAPEVALRLRAEQTGIATFAEPVAR